MRHGGAHVQQHLTHLILVIVGVYVAVLAVEIGPVRPDTYRRHPTLVRLDYVACFQCDRELSAELGLERLHRRQGTGREYDGASRRFKFAEHGRRV